MTQQQIRAIIDATIDRLEEHNLIDPNSFGCKSFDELTGELCKRFGIHFDSDYPECEGGQ